MCVIIIVGGWMETLAFCLVQILESFHLRTKILLNFNLGIFISVLYMKGAQKP